MFKFVTPTNAAIFTGILGIVLLLTGIPIGGSILIAASLLAFVYLRSVDIDSATDDFRRDEAAEAEKFHMEMADDMQQRQMSRYRD